jgi:uncharacterized protein YraI
MKKFGIAAAALVAALAAPTIASAATGFVTTNLNVRAGPGTQYPAVTVFPAGARVNVIGCTSGPGWCDVQGGGVRGWVSASYLDLAYDNRRVRAPAYVSRIGVPTITFSIGSYWDNHYRGRSFYNERHRWGGPRAVAPRPINPPRVERQRPPSIERPRDWRQERAQDRRGNQRMEQQRPGRGPQGDRRIIRQY